MDTFIEEIFFKKRSLYILSFLSFICFFYFTFISVVRPGYVGIVIDMLGSNNDSEIEQLTVGIHFVPPWKRVHEFPIFQQNHTWEGENNFFTFQTSEGMAVGAEIGITYHLRPEYIPHIFQKYRRGIDEITNIFIRNYIRDAINKSASKTRIEDLYSGKSIFFDEIEKTLRDNLSSSGIEISRIYLIGRFNFPSNVITALNAKIEAMQRAQQRENELREAEAEAKKQIALVEGQSKCMLLKSMAEAQSNEILSKSITPELISWQAVQKWDGKLPSVTSNSIPFIDIKNINK